MDSQKKKQWIKEHTVTVTVRYNINTDRDIIDKLRSVPNRSKYLKGLIRADLSK